MQFSLKWALSLTAYVALAAAAFTNGQPLYADLLWLATLAALAAAATIACLTCGRRQAAATGFVFFSGLFLLAAQFAPASVPTSRLVRWTAAYAAFPPPVYGPPTPSMPQAPYYDPNLINPVYPTPVPQPPVVVAPLPVVSYVESSGYLRAANSIAALLLGLFGAAIAPRACGLSTIDDRSISP